MRLLHTVLFAALAFSAGARTITPAEAQAAAMRMYQERSSTTAAPEEFELAKTITTNGSPLLYIFNRSGEKGFVLVTASEQVMPVPAYSFSGRYDESQENPAFYDWLNNYAEQVKYVLENNLPASQLITDNWNRLLGKSPSPPSVTAVGPLLTTTWNQTCYYNEQTPAGTSACGHQYTGCGATAMAQLMRYHNYPPAGTGSHSYTWNSITHSVNFGTTTYNWANMPNSISSSNSDVAQLMYHCGVALDMQYGNSVSNCYFNFNGTMPQYFGYAPTITNWFTLFEPNDTIYQTRIAAEHDSLRPVAYKGNGSSGQHFFVCDGYQNSGYPFHFHFNWGWGGLYDGYYYTSALNPGSYSFTLGQGAAIRIMPPSITLGANENAETPVSMFPNPAADVVTINTGESNSTIRISDMQGRVVFTAPAADKQQEINTSTFANGLYIVTVSTSRGTQQVQKLIISH